MNSLPDGSPSILSEANHRSRFRRALLNHYDRARRDLPWRGESDPYRVLVSEVMLQQTRVETVIGYYGRWLERFPDLAALADAEEDQVLKAWEGLGYYRRARNLHRAASVVRETMGGRLPTTAAELRTLPGLGEYTAGAVASIAFGEATPAVDGNVRRVLSRLFDRPDPKPVWLRARGRELIDAERPGDWNQALMELGATVCVPRAPSCEACPVALWCQARAEGTQRMRPVSRTRSEIRRASFALAVLWADGRTLLVKRTPEGLLAGMWAFPEVEADGAADPAGLVDRLGVTPLTAPERLSSVEHRFTHLHARYDPWLIEVADAVPIPGGRWVTIEESADLAVPVAQRRVLTLLATRMGARAG
jgi:A/G-specific adenine glycosylase